MFLFLRYQYKIVFITFLKKNLKLFEKLNLVTVYLKTGIRDFESFLKFA